MNPDQPNPKPPYQPGFFVRLSLWFGIYFAAQLPLIPYRQDWSWFPLGLVTPFLRLADKIAGHEIRLPSWTCNATYAFYIVHLIASLIVRRRTFYILVWTLIVIVLFNLAGCEMDQHLH